MNLCTYFFLAVWSVWAGNIMKLSSVSLSDLILFCSKKIIVPYVMLSVQVVLSCSLSFPNKFSFKLMHCLCLYWFKSNYVALNQWLYSVFNVLLWYLNCNCCVVANLVAMLKTFRLFVKSAVWHLLSVFSAWFLISFNFSVTSVSEQEGYFSSTFQDKIAVGFLTNSI